MTAANREDAHSRLQHSLNIPKHGHSFAASSGSAAPTRSLGSPFVPQLPRTPRQPSPSSTSSTYRSTTGTLSTLHTPSPSGSSHSTLPVRPDDLVAQHNRGRTPEVPRRSPRTHHAHSAHPPPSPHPLLAELDGNPQDQMGSFFDEAWHADPRGAISPSSPRDSPSPYRFHSLGRNPHKLTRMRP